MASRFLTEYRFDVTKLEPLVAKVGDLFMFEFLISSLLRKEISVGDQNFFGLILLQKLLLSLVLGDCSVYHLRSGGPYIFAASFS